MQNRYFNNSNASSTAQQSLSSAMPSTHTSISGSPIKPVSNHVPSSTRPISRAGTNVKPSPQTKPRTDELTRVFNTALVSSQAGAKRNVSAELAELTESAPFKTILNAVRQLACVQGIPERQAAEEVIKTFRKMDEVWNDYILREGLDRLCSPKSSK